MKVIQTISFLAMMSMLCVFAALTRGIDLVDEGESPIAYSTHYNDQEASGTPERAAKARWERILYRPTSEIVLPAVGMVLLFVVVITIVILRAQRRDMVFAEERIRFVGQVSHELKTPLTNIRLYAELLEEELQEENIEARSYSRVIVRETERLSRLISNVLRFNMQQNFVGRITPFPCDLEDLIQDVLEQFRPALSQHKIEIHRQARKTGFVSESVVVDPDALKQILGNLVSNVEKYAHSGKYLGIFIDRHDELIRLSVQDHGPGIPLEKWADVFDPFVRLSAGGDQDPSGTGIGLSISRELARLHGGDLRIEECEKGSLFVLSLPVQQQAGVSAQNQTEVI